MACIPDSFVAEPELRELTPFSMHSSQRNSYFVFRHFCICDQVGMIAMPTLDSGSVSPRPAVIDFSVYSPITAVPFLPFDALFSFASKFPVGRCRGNLALQ